MCGRTGRPALRRVLYFEMALDSIDWPNYWGLLFLGPLGHELLFLGLSAANGPKSQEFLHFEGANHFDRDTSSRVLGVFEKLNSIEERSEHADPT